MSPSTTSFVWQLARDLIFCGLSVTGLWFVTRRRQAWLKFVEHDLAADRRIGLPESYINFARRFCLGRGIIVVLWIFIVLSVLFLFSTVWFHLRATGRFNTSLEPTGVGAVSSAARSKSQVAGGSVLGRWAAFTR